MALKCLNILHLIFPSSIWHYINEIVRIFQGYKHSHHYGSQSETQKVSLYSHLECMKCYNIRLDWQTFWKYTLAIIKDNDFLLKQQSCDSLLYSWNFLYLCNSNILEFHYLQCGNHFIKEKVFYHSIKM